jgi:hypothetical protein
VARQAVCQRSARQPIVDPALGFHARRFSILPTEVRCQLPPNAVGTPLRFNSSESARFETKPAAMSFRMAEASSAARSSAASLFFKAACTPRLRDDAPPLRWSIRPSWPDLTPSQITCSASP